MSENERNAVRKKYTYLGLGLIALVFAYIVVSALVFKKVDIVYDIVIIVGLTAFWAIMDILAPIKAHDFDGRTPEQMAAYKKYAASDLLGYAGLMYFALAMVSNTGIYGALVYLGARVLKNKFRDEFEGITHDEEEDDTVDDDTVGDDTAVDVMADDNAAVDVTAEAAADDEQE